MSKHMNDTILIIAYVMENGLDSDVPTMIHAVFVIDTSEKRQHK